MSKPKNEPPAMPRITRLWAFVSVDDDTGDEGVLGTVLNGLAMPLIGADEARIASFRPLARRIAEQTGQVVTLARFETRVDQETLTPGTKQ